MDFGLNDKVALVAASSTGLGKAVAIGLAEEGANVIICSRDSDKLKLVSEEIQRRERREFLDFSIEDWKRAIDLNLMSAIYLCKEVIPYMVNQKSGRIVMITSVSVKQPINGLILSNVARAGVAGLAKSLSNEFGKNNILVNIVCPGYTQTQRVEQLATALSAEQGLKREKMIQKWAKLNALGRLATPKEFANVVVFLASESASHLTGTAIQIDGGLVKSLL
jgi:3-oxoacyl-[acyl-carrier protein] reductase